MAKSIFNTQTDILEMAKPDIERKKRINELVTTLKKLYKAGKTDNEIVEVIQSLNLPLDIHLGIMGNFTKLIKS